MSTAPDHDAEKFNEIAALLDERTRALLADAGLVPFEVEDDDEGTNRLVYQRARTSELGHRTECEARIWFEGDEIDLFSLMMLHDSEYPCVVSRTGDLDQSEDGPWDVEVWGVPDPEQLAIALKTFARAGDVFALLFDDELRREDYEEDVLDEGRRAELIEEYRQLARVAEEIELGKEQ